MVPYFHLHLEYIKFGNYLLLFGFPLLTNIALHCQNPQASIIHQKRELKTI